MGLKGAAAMTARPQVEETLDNLQKDTLGSLTNDVQKQQFETYSRRYRNSAAMDIGSHTDQQSNAWYGQVNDDTAKNSLDAIAANPDDPNGVMTAASDLTNAYVKTAQLNGAQPGDAVWNEAIQNAKKDAFKAQVQAIGTADPARAMRMLQKNSDLAGSDYAKLYDGLRTRADDQVATGFVTPKIRDYTGQAQQSYQTSPTNPTQPVYQQVASSIPGPYSPAGLARTVQIESGGKPVDNSIGMKGYGQFSDATWRAYGNGGDPHNLNDSVAAIQRYGEANARGFQSAFNRPPTDAESYIMHQQGGSGGLALMTNPNANAARLVGAAAITGNGGTTSMTAGQFVAMWTHKFNGTTPASGSPVPLAPAQPRAAMMPAQSAPDQGGEGQPETPVPAVANTVPAAASTEASAPTPGVLQTDIKGQVFADIDASDMSPEQKQIARTRAAQQIQAYQIESDQTAAAVKAANDEALNKYGTQILAGAGSPDLQAQILGDSHLTFEGKRTLLDLQAQHADQSQSASAAAYGSGFQATLGQVIAPDGDPSKLANPTDIYRLALGPKAVLTLAGAQKLVGIQATVRKSVDDANTTEALHALISGQKSKMSFQQLGDLQGPKDPKGEQLFNDRFVPKVLSAYDQWTKDGKDPWQFLTQDNFDKLAQGLRSPREMALAKVEAQAQVDTTQTPIPAPAGVDQTGWNEVLNVPMVSKGGRPWDQQSWATAVARLQQNPTDEVKKQFDSLFATPLINADDVLDILTPAGKTPEQVAAGRKANAGEMKDRDMGPGEPVQPEAAPVQPDAAPTTQLNPIPGAAF